MISTLPPNLFAYIFNMSPSGIEARQVYFQIGTNNEPTNISAARTNRSFEDLPIFCEILSICSLAFSLKKKGQGKNAAPFLDLVLAAASGWAVFPVFED